jgi:geranylgeranyl diphosphate synthase type II
LNLEQVKLRSMFNLESYLAERRDIVDKAMASRLPAADTRPRKLHEAIRYTVLSGGKRLRPILCTAAAETAGDSWQPALIPALAIEALHTYSLVHDDLPCMDNDDLRRGKPTLHRAYGDAIALLAGDALLTLAFDWMASIEAPPPYRPNRLSVELASAAGSEGMIGGQAEDIMSEGREADEDLLDYIHSNKTGALIRACVRIGCIVAGGGEVELDALSRYGSAVGLAFQIADDILNAVSTPEQLGKPAGSDVARRKATSVQLLGLDVARHRAEELAGTARDALDVFGERAAPLIALADHIVKRVS